MYETKVIVNAAGVYADVFHNMVSEKKIHITARKGEYFLLDKTAGGHVSHTVFTFAPEKLWKRSACYTDRAWKLAGGTYRNGYRRKKKETDTN